MSEVKRLFNPEFLNRLDEIIVFNALTDNDLIQILDLLVGQMNQNLAQKNISIDAVAVRPAGGFWTRPVWTVPTALGLCVGLCRSTLKIRSRRH